MKLKYLFFTLALSTINYGCLNTSNGSSSYSALKTTMEDTQYGNVSFEDQKNPEKIKPQAQFENIKSMCDSDISAGKALFGNCSFLIMSYVAGANTSRDINKAKQYLSVLNKLNANSGNIYPDYEKTFRKECENINYIKLDNFSGKFSQDEVQKINSQLQKDICSMNKELGI